MVGISGSNENPGFLQVGSSPAPAGFMLGLNKVFIVAVIEIEKDRNRSLHTIR